MPPALPSPDPRLPICCSPSSQTTVSSHFPQMGANHPLPLLTVSSPSYGCQWNSQLGRKSPGLTVQRPHPGQSPSLGLSLPICKMRFHLRALLAQAMWLPGLSVFPPKQQAPYLLSWLTLFCAFVSLMNDLSFPDGSDGKESACNAGDPGFESWVGKIPWKSAQQLTPIFLPGQSPWTEEPGGIQSTGSQRVDPMVDLVD